MDVSDFIVHRFASTSTLPCPTSAILDAGRDLIRQAISSTGWTNVYGEHAKVGRTGRTYVFSTPLPRIDCERRAVVCREWGVPVGADEDVQPLSELDEFEGTDFGYLSTKRRVLDTTPLLDIIPEPHVHLAPVSCIPTGLPPDARLKPYTKTTPVPISPHDCSTVEEYLRTPYARGAWIVPVRGRMEWEGCSTAVVLPGSAQEMIAGSGEITWTGESVVAFWTFLRAIRDGQALGPISYSLQRRNNREYVKIHVEVLYGLAVRNVLDAWRHEEPIKDKKTRVLKGSKLVFVDDRSKAVFLS